MKYFSPSYGFKLGVLSVPLFNDKTQGINTKSIDNNQKIKDGASNNTNLQSINQEGNFTNNTISNSANNEIDHFYENFLKTQGGSKDPQIAGQQLQEIQEEHHQFLKTQHENSRRIKRDVNSDRENAIEYQSNSGSEGEIYASFTPTYGEEIGYLREISNNREQFVESFKNKINGNVGMDGRIESFYYTSGVTAVGIANIIGNNGVSINNVGQQSSKRKMMRIEMKLNNTFATSILDSISFLKSIIRVMFSNLCNLQK